MEQQRKLRQGRSANLWTGQEKLLDKGKGMSERLNMQVFLKLKRSCHNLRYRNCYKDKLRVNIALKYMRKAHVEGSKADRERFKHSQ